MYNYVGPTWAQKSFDDPVTKTVATNFAKQWQLPYTAQLFPSTPPLSIAKQVKTNLPIIWVYSDPWGNVPEILKMSWAEYVSRPDWFDLWKYCNRQILKAINDLSVPVLLIGSHCDIIDCTYPNITVAHPSMQKWMAEQINLVKNNQISIPDENVLIDHCFAFEIYARFLYENPDVEGDNALKECLTDHWIFWKQLEKFGYMYDVHPTRKSYEQFAKLLKPTVEEFVNVR